MAKNQINRKKLGAAQNVLTEGTPANDWSGSERNLRDRYYAYLKAAPSGLKALKFNQWKQTASKGEAA